MRAIRYSMVAATVALAAAGVTACAPAPGGGGGGGGTGPTLVTGCFPGLLGGSFRITPGGFPSYYSLTPHTDAECAVVAGEPITIYPGSPDTSALSFCQAAFGVDATVRSDIGNAVVPAQTAWTCNVPV